MLRIDGRSHSRILFLLEKALNGKIESDVTDALDEIKDALMDSTPQVHIPEEILSSSAVANKNLLCFSQRDIDYINALMPWSSFIVDLEGRQFGNRYTEQKRNHPDSQRDPRIDRFAAFFDRPKDLSVVEYGCFEGNHTARLCELFGEVIGIDGRIENCLKSLVRCWMLDLRPQIHCLNLENLDLALPTTDLCHHVGVLYHLTQPVEHLLKVLGKTKRAMLLDTQIANPATCNIDINVLGKSVPAFRYNEKEIHFAPFAGLETFALWLTDDTICQLAESEKFEVIFKDIREERNGLRGSYIFRKVQ